MVGVVLNLVLFPEGREFSKLVKPRWSYPMNLLASYLKQTLPFHLAWTAWPLTVEHVLVWLNSWTCYLPNLSMVLIHFLCCICWCTFKKLLDHSLILTTNCDAAHCFMRVYGVLQVSSCWDCVSSRSHCCLRWTKPRAAFWTTTAS